MESPEFDLLICNCSRRECKLLCRAARSIRGLSPCGTLRHRSLHGGQRPKACANRFPDPQREKPTGDPIPGALQTRNFGLGRPPQAPLDTKSSPNLCKSVFDLRLQGVSQDAQLGQPTLLCTMRILSALGGCVPRKRSPGSAASWKKSTPRSASYPARSAIFAPRASASSSYSLE